MDETIDIVSKSQLSTILVFYVRYMTDEGVHDYKNDFWDTQMLVLIIMQLVYRNMSFINY